MALEGLTQPEGTNADFGIDYDLGEEAETVALTLSVEGVRQ